MDKEISSTYTYHFRIKVSVPWPNSWLPLAMVLFAV